MDFPLRLPKEVLKFVRRLTNEERREFSILLNNHDLRQLEESDQTANGRRHGEPSLYIGTTPKGLNLEIPDEHVQAIFMVLLEEITPSRIEVFLSGPSEYREHIFTKEQFRKVVNKNEHYLSDHYALVEMDASEIITSGEGCISIVFSEKIMAKRNVIATRILDSCGYAHTFSSDAFYAILWENELR